MSGSAGHEELDINLTPLLDLVLQLIMFFMITINFVRADQFDDSRGVALWGLAGTPAIARGTNRFQHIFVNGRAIRDRAIQHAIAEAYRGLIDPSRYPTAVLMLEHLGEEGAAGALMRAVEDVCGAGIVTPDLGGTATTAEVTRLFAALRRSQARRSRAASSSSSRAESFRESTRRAMRSLLANRAVGRGRSCNKVRVFS